MPELVENPNKLDILNWMAQNWAKGGADVAASPYHVIEALMKHGYKPGAAVGQPDYQGANNAAAAATMMAPGMMRKMPFGANPVSTAPINSATTPGINRGPNTYNPINTNLNLTGKPSNLNVPTTAKPMQEGYPNPPTAQQMDVQIQMANYLRGVKSRTGAKNVSTMHPADMYGTLPEANVNPGWKYPEMPEPFYGPNIAKENKFDAAWIQQQLKQKGHDPSKLTYDQMLKIMHGEE